MKFLRNTRMTITNNPDYSILNWPLMPVSIAASSSGSDRCLAWTLVFISRFPSSTPLSPSYPLPSPSSPAPIHIAMVDKLPSSPSILWRLHKSTFQHPIPFPLPLLPPCLKNPMPHPPLSLYYALSVYPTTPSNPHQPSYRCLSYPLVLLIGLLKPHDNTPTLTFLLPISFFLELELFPLSAY